MAFLGIQPVDGSQTTVDYRMNETTWVKWVEWAQAELRDNSVLTFLPYLFISELRHGPCTGGIHVDPCTLHVIAGNWQKGCVLVCRWMFVTRWTTKRSHHLVPCTIMARLWWMWSPTFCQSQVALPFPFVQRQFQDPTINDQNCSCSSYLQFPVSPETRGVKRRHFLKSPASSHCIQKTHFLPPSLSSFLQVCC